MTTDIGIVVPVTNIWRNLDIIYTMVPIRDFPRILKIGVMNQSKIMIL